MMSQKLLAKYVDSLSHHKLPIFFLLLLQFALRANLHISEWFFQLMDSEKRRRQIIVVNRQVHGTSIHGQDLLLCIG